MLSLYFNNVLYIGNSLQIYRNGANVILATTTQPVYTKEFIDEATAISKFSAIVAKFSGLDEYLDLDVLLAD